MTGGGARDGRDDDGDGGGREVFGVVKWVVGGFVAVFVVMHAAAGVAGVPPSAASLHGAGAAEMVAAAAHAVLSGVVRVAAFIAFLVLLVSHLR